MPGPPRHRSAGRTAGSSRRAGVPAARIPRGRRGIRTGACSTRRSARAMRRPGAPTASLPRPGGNPCRYPSGKSWRDLPVDGSLAGQTREYVAQFHARMEKTCLHGTYRALHDRGDIVQRMADAVYQFDHDALVGGEAVEALAQPVAQLAVFAGVVGGRAVFRHAVLVHGLAAVLAQGLQAAPIGDAHDPGGHARIALEGRGLLPGDPEAIVDRFFDDVAAPGQA